mgnify:CR=1 FL=1
MVAMNLQNERLYFTSPVGVGEEYPAPISLLSVQPLMKEVFRRTDTQRLSGCTYESWHFKNKNRRYNRAG